MQTVEIRAVGLSVGSTSPEYGYFQYYQALSQKKLLDPSLFGDKDDHFITTISITSTCWSGKDIERWLPKLAFNEL